MIITLSEFLWGRPLEQYAGSYEFRGAQRRTTYGAIPRQLAGAAAQRIGYYGGRFEAPLDPMKVTQQVSLEALNAVFRMSCDPSAYKIFLSPGLASGCITLMETIKHSGRALPFGHEYGYLCFRILLFLLGSSILARSGVRNLERAMKMVEDPQYATCLVSDIFSVQIAESLKKQMASSSQEVDCNWMLGWGIHKSHPRYDQIISREQAKRLLDILWEDRVDFLWATRLTFIPGLAALSFLIWRYTVPENKSIGANPELLKRTNKIHWRCLLVTTSNQEGPITIITDHICVSSGFDPRKKSIFEKSQDPRGIFEAFISRLAPTIPNLAIYDPLCADTLPALLDLVTPNLEPGVADLLPSLFGVTLNRLWEISRGENCTYECAILGIALTLEQFRTMFKSLREKNIARNTIARILEELVQGSLLELIASLFLSLDPDAEENSKKDVANFNLIQTTNPMIYELSESTPLDLLGQHFQDYADSWLKIYHQFDYLCLCIPDAEKNTERHRLRNKHYESCMTMWENLFNDLGQMDNLQAQELYNRCAYGRCQDPSRRAGLGTFYTCPQCLISHYCSSRCQIGDWKRGSHRKFCDWLATLHNSENPLASFVTHLVAKV